MKLKFPTELTISDEVSGKWYPFGVGIDCHRDMVWACVLQPIYESGKQKRDLSKFTTSLAGLALMRAWMEERVPVDHRRFLVESTSTYHFPVVRALPGWRPTVINPMLVGSAKRKTDRWDAQTLAHHSMAGTFPEHVLPTVAELALRTSYRRWLKIGHAIIRSTNALRTRMCMFGVNYAAATDSNLGWKIFSSMCVGKPPERHLISSPRHWAAQEYDDLVRQLPACVVAINQEQLREVAYLREERINVFKSCLAAIPDGLVELLCTVPFIKPVSATCFLAEIGFVPRRRFNNIKAIVSFAGFDPSKRVSADSVTSHMPTSGSKFLRRTILQVAGGALLSKHPLASYGHAIAARVGKRGWLAGRNAVGRKLVRWLSAVHFSGVPFTEGYVHGCKNAWGTHQGPEGDPFGTHGGFPLDVDWDSSGPPPDAWHWSEGTMGDATCGDPWEGWQDPVLRGQW